MATKITRPAPDSRNRKLHYAAGLALLLLTDFTPVLAGPEGGVITSGSGTIQNPDAQTTRIDQTSDSMSINWDSFNLAADELVQFNQPGRDAVSLNHILDQNPSSILGRIDANGRVFLMNPNGVIFGESARINVGGLVAGAFRMDDEHLNSGELLPEYRLIIGNGAAENHGVITAADGGSIALVGNHVVNNGSIVARLGKVSLLSADEATLSFDPDGMIQFAVARETLSNPTGNDTAVTNSGIIQADGGYVVLQGQAANDVFVNVVNNSGVIHAARINNDGGVIRLEGGGGNVVTSGVITAIGGTGSSGGSISLLGDRVGVYADALIDASGDAGGGVIHIGGGDNTAQFTQVTRDTSVKADALNTGDGGEILVWADDTTWALGSVSSKGGASSGDGGFIEISGKQGLVMDATIDLTAPNGNSGTVLFDPTNIIIHDKADGVQIDDGDLPDLSNGTVGAGTFEIGEDALEALASNANVILEATNTITLKNLADNILGLQLNNTGSLTITADTDGNGGSFLMEDTGDTISTQGADITISAYYVDIGSLDASGTTDGDIAITSNTSVSLVGATAGTGTINIAIDSDNNGTESVSFTGSLIGGSVNLQGGTDGGDTLEGKNLANTWVINGPNDGTYTTTGFSANFTNFAILQGGSNDDQFSFTGNGALTGYIDGGNDVTVDTVDYSASTNAGSVTINTDVLNVEVLVGGLIYDTLIADDISNAWSITGGDDGTVGTVTFYNFANLVGGSGADAFTLNGGSVSGSIDGSGGTDTLIGDNSANTWNITGADAGNVTGVAAFSDIENLTGNASTDNFVFANASSISGAVNGAGGSDTANFAAEATNPVSVTIGASGYSNIETYIGSTAVSSTLTASNVANTWVINGADSGTLTYSSITATFTNFANLTGGTDADSFTVSGGGTVDTIDGNSGSDTLAADNLANTWSISGADAGSLASVSGTITFSSIENLNGSGQTDTFDFDNAGSISETIDGSSGSDTVDLSAKLAAVTVDLADYTSIESFVGSAVAGNEIQGTAAATAWNITGANAGTIDAVISFSGFDTLTGNSGNDSFVFGSSGSISGSIAGGLGSDSLQGSNNGETWNISGADVGNISGDLAAFSGIESLLGGSGTDTFVFADAGSFSGSIDGGDATDDEIDFSLETSPVTIDLTLSTYLNIESYVGGVNTNTLIGKFTNNTWSITGADSGSVLSSGDLNSIAFSDFSILIGNDFQDTFTLSGTGSISSSITGGNGTDTLTANSAANSAWTISGADSGTETDVVAFSGIENISGGALNDSFAFTAAGSLSGILDGQGGTDTADYSAQAVVSVVLGSADVTNVETVIGNNTDSTLLAPTGDDNVWDITGTNDGTVQSGVFGPVSFTNFNNISGNVTDDTFQFQNGGVIDGVVDGGGGSDTADFSAVTVGTVNVTLSASAYTSVESFIGSASVASTLTGDNVANTWNITGADAGAVGAISFSDFQNITGGTDADSFTLNGGTLSGQIDGGAGTDTLTADSTANAWTITAADAGTVTGVGTFVNMENIAGSAGADTFAFNAGSSMSGTVDGGAGVDTVDLSALPGAINITLGSTGYDNIESYTGNGANSTLTGADIANSWDITGTNSGTVGSISFTDFANLQGGSDDDSFFINGGRLTGQLDGGAGSDLVLADNTSHTWSITGVETGNVDSVLGTTVFSGIETLQGNAAQDMFVFSNGSSFAGLIDGGANVATTDIVDYASLGTDITVSLSASQNINIEEFIGNGSGVINATLLGANTNNTWTITGTDAGDVNGIIFSGFNFLTGNASADTFTIQAGNISGAIDGGVGNDTLVAENVNNVWNVTAADAGDVTGSFSTDFQNVENLTGNSSIDTFNLDADVSGTVSGSDGNDIFNLNGSATVGGTIDGGDGNDTVNGPDIDITWLLTGIDTGVVNGSSFAAVENLGGGTGIDTFNITNSATAGLSGTMDGGAGDDFLTVDYNAGSTRTITYAGGTGTDTVSLTGSATGLTNTYDFGPAADDVTVATSDGGFTQTVVISETELVEDTVTADVVVFNGTGNNDAMTLAAGSLAGTDPARFSISGMTPVEFANKTDITVDGGAGTDSLTIDDAHAFNGDVTLTSESVIQGAGGELGAASLILNQVSTAGASGNRLQTDVGTLVINGPTADVYLTDQDDIALEVTNVTNILDVEVLSGNITSAGALVVPGSSVFTVANGGSITLDNAGNDFTGTLTFASSGTIDDLTVVDTTAVDLQALSISGDLAVTAGGLITQSGAFDVQGDSVFSAGSNGIVLTNAGNDFTGSVSLNNTGSNNVAITDQNALSFTSTALGSGTLTVTAGSIAQTGPITQQAGAGVTTFTANSGSLTLNNAANDFTGAVSLINTSGSATSITESDHLILGASSTNGGTLTVNAANGVSLTGTTESNNGNITITASTGDIVLGHLDAGSGTITLTATTGNVFGDNSPVTNPNLIGRDLVIVTSQAIGEFDNPIAVSVPAGGTGYFDSGIGVAHIIGFDGTIITGSDQVYDDTFLILAATKRENITFSPLFLESNEAYFSTTLYSLEDGGVLMPDYTKRNEDDLLEK